MYEHDFFLLELW